MPRPDSPNKFARFMMLATIVLVVASLYFAQEILVPIALAILLSFLLAPLVHRLERMKLPRVAAVLVTVVIAFGALGGVGYVVYYQLYDLASHLQEYETNIHAKVDSFRNGSGLVHNIEKARNDVSKILATPASRPAATRPSEKPTDVLKNVEPTTREPMPVVVTNPAAPQTSSESPWGLVESVGGRMLGPIGTALLIIILTVFMLLQREDLRDRLIRLLGRGQLTVTTQALDDAAERVSRYLMVQSILNGSEGVAVMIALWLIGRLNGHPFPSPALWGLLTALLRFVPYIGIWLSAIMPIALSLAVYSSGKVAFETAGAYVAIELTLANAIEPFVLGSSTGMAPLAVLVAATFWTWLWGPMGLLLSTPLTVCLVVLGKYVPQMEFLSILLGDEPALSPPARVYQRLLALDQEEAEELVHEYAAKTTLVELYDTIFLPALAMAEWDWHRDQLDEKRHQFIRNGLRDLIEQTAEQQRSAALATAAENTVREARGDMPIPPAPKPTISPAPATAQLGALAAPPKPMRYAIPRNCVVTVACIPAQKEDDELIALMLGRLLEIRGYCVKLVSVAQLASEVLETVEREKIDAVCISALPPGATAHARYLCKRLRAKFPQLPMAVGLWRSHRDLEQARQRLGCSDQVQVIATLADALRVMHQLVQSRLVELTGESPAATE